MFLYKCLAICFKISNQVKKEEQIIWKTRENRLRPLLGKLQPPQRNVELWADLGSGSGFFTRILKEQISNAIVIQFDIRLPHSHKDLFVLGDIRFLPFRTISFDGILCSQVMHYFSQNERKKILHQITKVLKPNGFLVLIEYNTSRNASWIPYPLPLNDFSKELSLFPELTISEIVEADLNYRPKYALYLKKTFLKNQNDGF